METWRRVAGTLQARCRYVDEEAWRYGALEARCRRADVEAWRSGDALPAKRRGGTEVCMRCRPVHVRGLEVWRSRGALEGGDTEEWRRRAFEARCRCSDMDVWSSKGRWRCSDMNV